MKRFAVLGVLSAAALIIQGLPALADDPPVIGSKTRRGAKVSGKVASKTTRKSVIMGESREDVRKVGKRPRGRVVRWCGVGGYDGTSCVEPRSRVELYPREERGRPRVVRPVRPDRRLITTTVVRTAVRDVAFPRLSVRVQPPGGRTLVNLKTIVYTEPEPFETVVPILTWPVTVRATPQFYTWHFGDGTTRTTDSPGAPYPSFAVFHQYQRRGAVQLRVTVHYAARYRAPGEDWRSIGTVPITGPVTALLVCESKPTLVDPANSNITSPSHRTNPCIRTN
jgi:hypothetical protein